MWKHVATVNIFVSMSFILTIWATVATILIGTFNTETSIKEDLWFLLRGKTGMGVYLV